jgi:hypothetical protein
MFFAISVILVTLLTYSAGLTPGIPDIKPQKDGFAMITPKLMIEW